MIPAEQSKAFDTCCAISVLNPFKFLSGRAPALRTLFKGEAADSTGTACVISEFALKIVLLSPMNKESGREGNEKHYIEITLCLSTEEGTLLESEKRLLCSTLHANLNQMLHKYICPDFFPPRINKN